MLDPRLDEFLDAAVRNPGHARDMLRAHPDLLTVRCLNGETPLHYLAVEGYARAVEFLAAQGADPDAVNEFGDTPLVDVATLGKLDVAEVLLRLGADPNATSNTRSCPLHAAVCYGYAELAARLLEAGARWDYRTDLEETVWDAVEKAPVRRREELTETLSRYGARRPTKE